MLSFAASRILGETHVAILLPFLFLFALQIENGSSLWLKLVVIQSALLGPAYVLYHNLVKFS